MKIVCDDKIPFVRGVFEPFAEVDYVNGADITRAVVSDADALVVRTRTRCDAALLDGSRVRVVGTATIGTDHLDIDYLNRRGILWTNAPGCNSNSVAQYVLSALMRLDMELRGLAIGIIGCGNVGSKVARISSVLGMRVLVCDPMKSNADMGEGVALVSQDELLRESDIVTLHVPLSRGEPHRTFHMVDRAFVSSVRRGAVLINSSRGEVVDTAELKTAIGDGTLSSVICDVWENEPNIDLDLLDMCTFATPHVAGYSADGKANGTTAVVRFVARAFGIGELCSWSPESIPVPDGGPEIRLDGCSDPVRRAVLASYDIAADSAMLKACPESFEDMRGHYRVRREPQAYSVSGVCGSSREVLDALGFQCAADD